MYNKEEIEDIKTQISSLQRIIIDIQVKKEEKDFIKKNLLEEVIIIKKLLMSILIFLAILTFLGFLILGNL